MVANFRMLDFCDVDTRGMDYKERIMAEKLLSSRLIITFTGGIYMYYFVEDGGWKDYAKEKFYTKKYTSILEWLELCEGDEIIFPTHCVPYYEWIEDIVDLNDEEIKHILRVILSPYTTNMDISKEEEFLIINEKMKFGEIVPNSDLILEVYQKKESIYRMLSGNHAWEGLTWIIPLLEQSPIKAFEVLSTYILAEGFSTTDERMSGILDCMKIIELKYLKSTDGVEFLQTLKSREFELLVGYLYEAMGYDVVITPETRDGGKDAIATKGTDKVCIECKLYKKTNLKVNNLRELGYVMYTNNATKASLFTTGYVASTLKNFDPRITVIDEDEILNLLNAYLGKTWMTKFQSKKRLK